MHTLRLLATHIKVNLQIALAYRADTLVNMLVNLMWLGFELLGLAIIFSNTQTLAGWNFGELLALLGVFRLVNMLMAAMIWPATEKFNASVRDGSLDYTLLQPADSLFLISISRLVVWRAWDLVLGLILIIIGIRMSGGATSPLNLASFLLLAAMGMVIIYSLWVVMVALTFWFIKFDNNVTILQALLDAGRYPATVYPGWLRLIITFLVPVAVATTIPLQALRGELSSWQVLFFFSLGVAALTIARQVWKAGLRQYSGASS